MFEKAASPAFFKIAYLVFEEIAGQAQLFRPIRPWWLGSHSAPEYQSELCSSDWVPVPLNHTICNEV